MLNKVLIIDDEEKIRSLLSKIITLEGFEVWQAENAKAALKKLENIAIDVVICDVKLPDINGVELAKIIQEKYPYIETILLTAYGNIPDGVLAIKNGAFDYITKGDDNHKIIPLLHKAIEKVVLAKRVRQLEKQLANKHNFGHIIGQSKIIRTAIEEAKKVALTDATVLLTGETGTGKEIFAQAIHTESNRSKHPFMAINCAAFSKDLLENELFGHKAGAFTGALKETKGIFEEAHQGTVFLDEIGEMPLDLQAKLLRVLETGEFLKVGDSKTTRINVRIIAATNRNLKSQTESGQFREDLYYRIAVFYIALPALRERPNDIEALANHFLNRFASKTGKKIEAISPDYLEALKKHTWKGNIRELRNIIERSMILTNNTTLHLSSLPTELLSFNTTQPLNTHTEHELAGAEKRHILKVLNSVNGNKTETAKRLNIALTTLYRKLAEYGIT